MHGFVKSGLINIFLMVTIVFVHIVTTNQSRKDQAVAPKKLSLTSLSTGVESTFEASFLLNFRKSAIEVTLDTQNTPNNLYDLKALAGQHKICLPLQVAESS